MKVRIVLVGAGYWGSNIARALRSVEGAELAAVVDLDEARARRLAEAHGVGWSTTLSGAVSRWDPDAAVVAVSPSSLAPVALEAIEYGLSVLVEKPLALSARDARRVAEKADRKGVVGAVGFVVRFDPVTDLLEQLIPRLEVYEAHFVRIGRRPPWLRRVPIAFDLTIHDVDLAMHLLGCRLEPVSVHVASIAGDEAVYASYRCGGVTVFTATSGTSLVKVRRLSLYGERLVVEADMVSSTMEVRSRHGVYAVQARRDREPLVRELQAFVDKIKGVEAGHDVGKLATLWDGVRAVEVVESLVKPAKRGG